MGLNPSVQYIARRNNLSNLIKTLSENKVEQDIKKMYEIGEENLKDNFDKMEQTLKSQKETIDDLSTKIQDLQKNIPPFEKSFKNIIQRLDLLEKQLTDQQESLKILVTEQKDRNNINQVELQIKINNGESRPQQLNKQIKQIKDKQEQVPLRYYIYFYSYWAFLIWLLWFVFSVDRNKRK